MSRILLLLSLLTAGCGIWTLDPHGKSSICAATHPTLQGAVLEAVDYWNRAGLETLTACSPGSIELELVDPATIPDKAAITKETSDGVLHIKMDRGVLDWVQDDRLWVREFGAAVMAHELGHALGLPHSTDKLSIMWPDVEGFQDPVYHLDVEWAQDLLGGHFPKGDCSIFSCPNP